MANRLIKWCENASTLLGRITLILSLGMMFVGFPSQIWKNYQDQACGMSLIMITLLSSIYSVRIPYSIGKRAWHLIPTDALGLLATVILLVQYFYYG